MNRLIGISLLAAWSARALDLWIPLFSGGLSVSLAVQLDYMRAWGASQAELDAAAGDQSSRVYLYSALCIGGIALCALGLWARSRTQSRTLFVLAASMYLVVWLLQDSFRSIGVFDAMILKMKLASTTATMTHFVLFDIAFPILCLGGILLLFRPLRPR